MSSDLVYLATLKIWYAVGSIYSILASFNDSKYIKEIVHVDGKTIDVIPTSQMDYEEIYYQKEPYENNLLSSDNLIKTKFGKPYGTRSGDKGGCVNLGVWAKNQDAYSYLYDF